MSDAAWTALTQILTALFALLAALFAHGAGTKAQATAAKLEEHETASQERGRLLRSEVRAAAPGFHPGSEGTVPPSQQG